ncbi:ATP synthase subunit delta, mitochondrial [Rhineura floridana]|uniref:ATP synthase subunit delta, mitochondrial n=1 Tax=Rhineura floridana TaxID=261503 RepID=UPI002AC800BB|nr:ATP synthase subunit delta, mitochondrial [Rhineura floridana]
MPRDWDLFPSRGVPGVVVRPLPSFASSLALGFAMLPLSRFLARASALGSRGQVRHYAEAAVAGQAQMAFTFASPTQVFYNAANVKQVDVPTLSGSFGILAAHVPTLQVLKPGIVTVFAEDGSSTKYFVSSGSITVHADSSVQLLAEEVALLDQLDVATAKSNLEKALSALASASDEAAKAEAQISVEANEAIVKALE